MFCKACGSQINDVHKFCAKCGAKVERSIIEPAPEFIIESAPEPIIEPIPQPIIPQAPEISVASESAPEHMASPEKDLNFIVRLLCLVFCLVPPVGLIIGFGFRMVKNRIKSSFGKTLVMLSVLNFVIIIGLAVCVYLFGEDLISVIQSFKETLKSMLRL